MTRPNHKPQDTGRRGEIAVRDLLLRSGRRCHLGKRSGNNADPWDILVDGRIRVEVKTADPQIKNSTMPSWLFNIHRHGVLLESEVDLYVLRLEQVAFCPRAIHLLFPSPLGCMTKIIGFRHLLNGLSENVRAFYEFKVTGKNPFKERI